MYLPQIAYDFLCSFPWYIMIQISMFLPLYVWILEVSNHMLLHFLISFYLPVCMCQLPELNLGWFLDFFSHLHYSRIPHGWPRPWTLKSTIWWPLRWKWSRPTHPWLSQPHPWLPSPSNYQHFGPWTLTHGSSKQKRSSLCTISPPQRPSISMLWVPWMQRPQCDWLHSFSTSVFPTPTPSSNSCCSTHTDFGWQTSPLVLQYYWLWWQEILRGDGPDVVAAGRETREILAVLCL